MCRLLKVTGNSLLPVYREGDFVFISKISLFLQRLRPGDTVVFEKDSYGILIKNVDHLLPGGEEAFVLGTDPYSVDSRRFGPLKKSEMMGRVIFHIKKPG